MVEAPALFAECGSEGMDGGVVAVRGGGQGEKWHIRRIRELIQCADSLLDRISPAMPGRPPPSPPPPPLTALRQPPPPPPHFQNTQASQDRESEVRQEGDGRQRG